MGIFDRFRKKKKTKREAGGIVMSDEEAASYFMSLKEFDLEEEIEKRVEERIRQQRILAQRMSQIKPTYQKLLIAVTPEEGSIILGYPESYMINYDEYWIYYQERPPNWLDHIWWSLARIFGKQPPHKILKAHKKIVQFNNETITVYCQSVTEYRGTGIQEAIPMVVHPAITAGWEAYEAVKAERDKYKEKYFELLRLSKKEVELALQINPRVKVYWKEKEQQGKKTEERFGGTEMEFEENPIKRELKSIIGE
ncbi:hypothetical protein [Thermococcus barophilus]|uniref:Uncharacterized protein n=1 Tax=Thermococcus barophilus TaxID=55802 RepID=A0A0S1XEH9_THEBA|nr:hypothetical protein [Thermococcus barophilus]ALM76220.1 hypothetical protein TBCH5v1_2325 [Thermococcus barophilus]